MSADHRGDGVRLAGGLMGALEHSRCGTSEGSLGREGPLGGRESGAKGVWGGPGREARGRRGARKGGWGGRETRAAEGSLGREGGWGGPTGAAQ
jgi:hypothetical protein